MTGRDEAKDNFNMAQQTYIARKGEDADFANVTASGTLAVTGTATFTAAPTFSAVSGVTTVGPLVKIAATIAYDDFTDNTDATGTYEMSTYSIPVGATFLYAAITAVTGFAGDTSATITIGDGTDVDRYHTGTPNVFATAANGVSVGAPSGTLYHDTAATPTLIVTSNSDFTSVSAGSVTVELYYLT